MLRARLGQSPARPGPLTGLLTHIDAGQISRSNAGLIQVRLASPDLLSRHPSCGMP